MKREVGLAEESVGEGMTGREHYDHQFLKKRPAQSGLEPGAASVGSAAEIADPGFRAALRAYPELGGVTVKLQNGRLVLSGRVTSWYLKQFAQEAVRSIDRIHRLINSIQVDGIGG